MLLSSSQTGAGGELSLGEGELELGMGSVGSRDLLGTCLGLVVSSIYRRRALRGSSPRIAALGSSIEHGPSLPLPSQYTIKLQQELQKLKVDVKNLDLLSPAARRDLEALQSSGFESIHYPGFLAEVSSGHLRPDLGRSEEVGWVTVSPHLGPPFSLDFPTCL